MGIALWLLCGLVVFLTIRAIEAGRPRGFAAELIIAMIVAFAAGVGATALDFGGWREPDWRAGAFVICATFAAIGLSRAAIAILRRTVVH